ncbi:nicotinamide-nucleotide adenylyltransferase [Candidatus Woesearchaeota archaeon]|nr:nicotinamide-nucleotide adenylyltransferase [Candidatus Woesearchaeota archaeon]
MSEEESKLIQRVGMFLGRFQPLHKGHMKIIQLALSEVSQLKIVIGSSQASNEKNNPFTAEERNQMITLVFGREIDANRIALYHVPDINCDDRYAEHLVSVTGKFDIVYAADNELTYNLFSKDYQVEKHERINDYASTEIRRRIKAKESWRELVDEKIYRYILAIEGDKRILEI